MQQPTNVLQRVRYGLQEMSFAFVESTETVCAHRLHDTDVNVRIVMLQKNVTLQIAVTSEGLQIMIQQVLPQARRQIGLRVKQQRGNIILERAFAAALIIQEERLTIPQHDIPRLKVSI